jgi:FkbM family methyltransferase
VSAWRQPVRRARRRLRQRLRPSAIERRIGQLGLRHGDLAIDCGANIGEVTAALAEAGAEVHAFEPNPAAFSVLVERLGQERNVRLYPQAVLDRVGHSRLYLHVNAADDPVAASVGSSLLASKGNVDPDEYVEVETIDLAQFVCDLDRPVGVVKIDVEGVECTVVHRLLDTGAIERVQTVLVELHDRHIPELQAENQRLRERIEWEGLSDRILTDWR